MKQYNKILALAITFIALLTPLKSALSKEYKVKITEDLSYIEVQQDGEIVRIKRNQDITNRLSNSFTKTSRVCPPFCISPIKVGTNITTAGELEVIDFLNKSVRNKKGLLVDARMQDWFARGTIPGAVNIPFTVLSMGIENKHIQKILTVLGAKKKGNQWDFSKALELMLFCNGPWCQQSHKALNNLSKLGYPEEKLFWYRSGMQAWQQLGLTVVTP